MDSKITISEKIYGLVLAGGKSSRMGQDKAAFIYHGISQQYYIYNLLKKYCQSVFISCNQNQKKTIIAEYNPIEDNNKFGDIGPMAGLLSYITVNSYMPVLLIACDYPYLTESDIELIFKNRKPEYDVICYKNEDTGFEEPLIAMYETSALKKLKLFYNNGNTSLRLFISTINTKTLKPLSSKSITSVDTIEKAEEVIKKLKKIND